MSNDRLFSMPFNPILSEFMRRERERREIFERALGPANRLQKQMDALTSPFQNIITAQELPVVRTIRIFEERYKHLATPHWALSIQQSAKNIAQLSIAAGDGKLPRLRNLSGTLGAILSMHKQSAALNSLVAGSEWSEKFRALSAQLSPSLTTFTVIAQQMALFDKLRLQLSDDDEVSIAEDVAARMIEAQEIIEALGEVETPEEGIALYFSFLTIFTTFFVRFGENTLDELRKLGLVGLIGLISAAYTFIPNEQQSGQSQEQATEFADLRVAVEAMQAQLQIAQETDQALNDAFTKGLARGELNRKSNFRSSPAKDASKIATASAGTPIALIGKKGRWKHVVFRDSLTGQLLQGWVFGTAVTLFEQATGQYPSVEIAAKGGILAALRRSPLLGAELDVTRAQIDGRQIEF
jgi:hypothetical protein